MSKNVNVSAVKKAARVIAAVCLLVLIAAVIGYVISGFMIKKAGEDPMAWYKAAMGEYICFWVMIVAGAATVVLGGWAYWAEVKETLRKYVVSLKRNPSVIPLVVMLAAFLLYSLNLTHMSDTTAKIQGKGMGLSQFAIMLLSMLSLVCMLNSYPRRKKPNLPMIGLSCVMFGVVIYCDIHYRNAVFAALTRPENPIVINASTTYIAQAYNMLNTYMVLVIIAAVLLVTVPLYGKLLRRINTSVYVEDNGEMGTIEITEE